MWTNADIVPDRRHEENPNKPDKPKSEGFVILKVPLKKSRHLLEYWLRFIKCDIQNQALRLRTPQMWYRSTSLCRSVGGGYQRLAIERNIRRQVLEIIDEDYLKRGIVASFQFEEWSTVCPGFAKSSSCSSLAQSEEFRSLPSSRPSPTGGKYSSLWSST